MRALKTPVIFVLVISFLFPAMASAAPPAGGRLPPIIPPVKGGGGSALQISWIQDQEGKRHRVAHRMVADGAGQRLDFWIIETDAELGTLQSFIAEEETSNRILAEGFRRLPRGGWIWWNNELIQIFVSHDWVVDARLFSNILTIIYGVAVLVLPHPLVKALGAYMVFATQLEMAFIEWLDDKGDPGFYIYVRINPTRIWFRP